MKFGPVTKHDKRGNTTYEQFDRDAMPENCNIIVLFQFMTNLEQSGSQILDAQFVKRIFSLKVTFYLTKSENRTKNLQRSFHTIALSKGSNFAEKY